MDKRIAFIGCGNMGEALLKGLIEKGLFRRTAITVSDRRSSRRGYVRRVYRVGVSSSNSAAVKKSDIVLLAVKPQDIVGTLNELRGLVADKLIITIAAGITSDYIRRKTGSKSVIRAMPNTPSLVGCGITAITAAAGVSASDIRLADKIFSCVGEVVHLKERQMDSVTAVSGSGPAYFFLLMEAMIKAAVSLGLSRCVAERLTLQTAFGATALQQKSKNHPSQLRKKVTSKGGTTEAALAVFKSRGFQRIVGYAIRTAARKAKELSK